MRAPATLVTKLRPPPLEFSCSEDFNYEDLTANFAKVDAHGQSTGRGVKLP